ncbi:MAG: type II toxin-antitoxin system death-on-curing family toxin [Verrucomicrobiota bacterium]|jgi:death-on-curing protein
MTEPVWLSRAQIEAIHDDQLQQHGGLAGIRAPEGLESARARPLNLFLHEKTDLAALVVTYAHGIIKNHPFLDGNKRTAFAAAAVFLDMNGVEITMTEQEATVMVLSLADGSITRKQFTELLRQHSRKIKGG